MHSGAAAPSVGRSVPGARCGLGASGRAAAWAPRWPGRAAAGPAHSWPGRRARRAPCASSWLRAGRPGAPRAGGGAWPGRRRAPTHWPFVQQLGPSPPGSRAAPRPPRAVAPGKFASPGWAGRWRETPRAAPPPGSETAASRGLLGSCVPEGRRLRAGHSRSPPAGKCAAAKGKREGECPGSRRRPASPGPWPPDKGVLEVAEAHFFFPQQGLVEGRKVLKTHLCPLLAEKCVSLPGKLRRVRRVGIRTRGPGARPWLRSRPRWRSPPAAEVCACDQCHHPWLGSPPRTQPCAIPAGLIPSWCGPTR